MIRIQYQEWLDIENALMAVQMVTRGQCSSEELWRSVDLSADKVFDHPIGGLVGTAAKCLRVDKRRQIEWTETGALLAVDPGGQTWGLYLSLTDGRWRCHVPRCRIELDGFRELAEIVNAAERVLGRAEYDYVFKE